MRPSWLDSFDYAFESPIKPATTRLYLRPDEAPARPEDQVSNLRFQFDPTHRVAAAVLLVIDRDAGRLRSWRTVGDAGRPDVVLAHDSWNEHETRLPVESFITTPNSGRRSSSGRSGTRCRH